MEKVEYLRNIYEGIINKYSEMRLEENGKKNTTRSIERLFQKNKYGEIHHRICKLMFEMAENGEELWVHIDHILQEYDSEKSNNIEQEEGAGEFIQLSLLTPTMLDYDRGIYEIVQSGWDQTIYRPYFFHFVVDINQMEESGFDFLRNEERWNQWYRGSFQQDLKGDNILSFSGYVEKVASPVTYSKRKLFIIDEKLPDKIVNNINYTYNFSDNSCVEDKDVKCELYRLLGDTVFTKGRVYSVGNGNCIYLYGKRKDQGCLSRRKLLGIDASERIRVLYDIGYHVSAVPSKLLETGKQPRATKAIRMLQPTCIILSHWDSDHYMGCAYGRDSLFNCRWIAPDCKDATPNAKRLAKYLKLKKKLMLIEREENKKETGGREISTVPRTVPELRLWMGGNGGKEDRRLTKANRQGLVLELLNKRKTSIHCLMMGDVPYQSFKDAIKTETIDPCNYLIVPHHGSAMGTSVIPEAIAPGVAIVCAKRGKHRLNAKHEEMLSSKGYVVELTGTAGLCIDFTLRGSLNWWVKD